MRRAAKGRDKILKVIVRWRRAGLAAALAGLALGACQPATDHARALARAPDLHALAAQGLSDRALFAATAALPPGVSDLARRHDPGLRRADLWGRPLGWTNLDLRQVPDLGFSTQEGEGAVVINNLRPFAGLPIRPMRPFVLKAPPPVKGDKRIAEALKQLSRLKYGRDRSIVEMEIEERTRLNAPQPEAGKKA